MEPWDTRGLDGDIGQAFVDRKLGRRFAFSYPGLENAASSRGARTDRRERTRTAALAAAGTARTEAWRSLAVGPCPAPARGTARALRLRQPGSGERAAVPEHRRTSDRNHRLLGEPVCAGRPAPPPHPPHHLPQRLSLHPPP